MRERHLSRSDRLISHIDSALRTLIPNTRGAQRTNPASGAPEAALDELERRHAASTLRVLHLATAGVQGLCQGQVGLVMLPKARLQIDQAQREATDHLAWCQQRLAQLESRTSYFTPVYYGAGVGLGLVSGWVGDRFGLGMVAASKEVLGRRTNDQMSYLSSDDQRSRTLLRQIVADNTHHAQLAVEAGGLRFPAPVKWSMGALGAASLKKARYT
ncbi:MULTISPECIES: demethoxyubiquinone hydroxylase family protein [unclassified Halomonas]|uniref:3-demethoxyubiquinol 3-hydroxylase n=1 Tax=unclassified Halomonas TaxID=2609666 RepID=UPI00209D5BD7|nr:MULTISPECIES: demethoxyubiquinone hydroxylase family protein [unclassified Halomonas]MCP1314630.1 demethoxyubiquinone hydroxylase family protein [Halomonas sp. 707D7]MCP1325474.1 demethoxyubiquinone hydroxylase family protein [Halomonas sp. 707D4]